MSTSSAVVAGTNATATAYNNLRTDAITRYVRFVFEIKGTIGVADVQGPRYIVPANMTVTEVKSILDAGSATIRIDKDGSAVISSVAVTTSPGSDTGISSAAITEDQVLTLDVTAATGASGLLVEVLATETI